MSSTENLFHPVPIHAGFEPRAHFAAFPQVSNDRHYQPDSTPPIHDSPLMMPHQHLGHTPRSVSLGSVGLASDAGIHLGAPQGQYDYAAAAGILHHSSPGTFNHTTSSQHSGSPYSTPIPAHQALRQPPATWPSMPALTRTFSDSFVPVQMPNFDTGAQSMPMFTQAHRYLPAYGAHNAYMYQQPDGLQQDADFMEPRNPTSTKAKKHICVVCDKRFSRPSSLTTHMSVHTGAKPFVCQHQGCGRRFSVGSNLRRHLKTHDDSNSLQSSTSSSTKSASSAARSLSQTPHYHPYLQPAENLPGHFVEDTPDLSFALAGDATAVNPQSFQLADQTFGQPLAMPQADDIVQPFGPASFDMQRQGSGDSTDSNVGDDRDDGLHFHNQPTTPGTPPHLALSYDIHDRENDKQFH